MGRGHEGKFYNYCTAHVQEYNKSYNYFSGMKDDDDAGVPEERPPRRASDLETGPECHAQCVQRAPPGRPAARRPLRPRRNAAKAPGRHPSGRALRSTELKALQTLGLDDTATPEQVKSQYKTLVKRLHPDANNGSRANEDTLKAVIQAYDHLRSSGFC